MKDGRRRGCGRPSGQVTGVSLHGGELEATAVDFPSLPVPGAWNGLPVAPARLSWRLETVRGAVVVPEHVVFDATRRLPAASFWSVYARGTHQNMTAFRDFYASGSRARPSSASALRTSRPAPTASSSPRPTSAGTTAPAPRPSSCPDRSD